MTIATVHYHVHRPFRQGFVLDAFGTVGALVSPTLCPHDVNVRDVREGRAPSFERDGVEFVSLPTNVRIGDDAAEWEHAYNTELQRLLMERLDATEVVVFDHTVRVDDPDAERRPARHVHSDYSSASAQQRLVDVLGERAATTWSQGRYAFINVWRPVGAVVQSAPLGFVHPTSAQASDWVALDLRYPDRLGEILGLTHATSHQWLFQSHMTPDELVFFRIYDSDGHPPVPHSALDVVGQPAAVRRSIESRTLVRFH